MRKPKEYIPGYDKPNYATGLWALFFHERSPPGRPKVPDETKEFKLIQLLLDIDRLKLTRIIGWEQIANRLRREFGLKYPKTKSSKLRKDIAAAFALLHKNALRVKDERLSRLLGLYRRFLAK